MRSSHIASHLFFDGIKEMLFFVSNFIETAKFFSKSIDFLGKYDKINVINYI